MCKESASVIAYRLYESLYLSKIGECKSPEELQTIWNKYQKALKSNQIIATLEGYKYRPQQKEK